MDEYKNMLKKINLKDKKYQQILDHNVKNWISTFQVGGDDDDIAYGNIDEEILRFSLKKTGGAEIYVRKMPTGDKTPNGNMTTNDTDKLIRILKDLNSDSYLIFFNNIINPDLKKSIKKAFENLENLDTAGNKQHRTDLQQLTVILFYHAILKIEIDNILKEIKKNKGGGEGYEGGSLLRGVYKGGGLRQGDVVTWPHPSRQIPEGSKGTIESITSKGVVVDFKELSKKFIFTSSESKELRIVVESVSLGKASNPNASGSASAGSTPKGPSANASASGSASAGSASSTPRGSMIATEAEDKRIMILNSDNKFKITQDDELTDKNFPVILKSLLDIKIYLKCIILFKDPTSLVGSLEQHNDYVLKLVSNIVDIVNHLKDKSEEY